MAISFLSHTLREYTTGDPDTGGETAVMGGMVGMTPSLPSHFPRGFLVPMFPQAVRPSGRSPSRCRWTPPKGMILIHPDPSIWLWGTPEGPCHVGAWEGNRLPCILHIEDCSHVSCNLVTNVCCFFLTPNMTQKKTLVPPTSLVFALLGYVICVVMGLGQFAPEEL